MQITVEAFNNMGITLYELGKLGEAIEAYNNALLLKSLIVLKLLKT